MNADPEKGQPTTVPETTAPESTPPEMTTPETTESETDASEPDAAETDTSESDAAEADASEPDASADQPAEDEARAPEASADESAEDEARAPEASADESAEAEASTPETSESEAAESKASEPESAEAEATSDEAPAAEAVEPEATEAPAAEPEPDVAGPAEPEAIEIPAPASPKSASTTPLVAGRYRLVAEIGGGAMGVVWRARDEVLGRDVAVKELRPDHGMSGAQVRTSHQRARREGRIAARLQHPNAVVIYDVAEHDGRPYLIMEYVPSQSLGDILATGAVLTPAEVTSIGAQLASALTAAHERGIVHRDIKPGNVLMTSDGTVKLTDFGISRAAGDATVTATGEILGTPAYTAPEVAQGHPVAFPADVFSLGATLYAAVEGTPPFGEDVNAMALLLRVVRNEIRSPKRSGPLTDTVMWMLSPEPADRPTMKQVWQGLDRLSAKPLPSLGIRALTPETKAFAAPAPTIVVPEAASAKSGTITPEPASEPLPASVTPPPMPIPAPTPRSISSRVTAPTSEPASTPTSKSASIAATPTSAMPAGASAHDTRDTRKSPALAAAAAEPPASTPPPASKSPAPSPASPPPAKRSRSRMPLAIAVCVVGTAVLVVAIVVAMNSGSHDSPNQPVAHGSTASTPTSPAHSTTPSRPSTTPSSSAGSGPSQPSSPSSTPSSTAPTSSAPTSTASTSASTLSSDPVAFVSNYYALLPGNLTAAWPQMTQAYQDSVAHGFSNYQIFWNGIQQVTLSDVTATGPSTVVAMIHYTNKDGTSSTERTTFGLTKNGTSWQINTSHTG